MWMNSRPRPARACLGWQVAMPVDVLGHKGAGKPIDISAAAQAAEVRLIALRDLIKQRIPMHLCANAGRCDGHVNRLAPVMRFEVGIAGDER